jgi:hypothetical protein
MSRHAHPTALILTTVRFVWIDEKLHLKSFRGLLNSHEYPDYETFFNSTVTNVAFHHPYGTWDRYQLIIDNGWHLPKTIHDRTNPGPVIIPYHSDILLTFFNRTMIVPVHLRLGESWQPSSTEVWSIPVDVEMNIRQLKEYLLTADFRLPAESILNRMRKERSKYFDAKKLQQALEYNDELSTFSLSFQYEHEDVIYPDVGKLVVNLFSMEPSTHISPRITFGVIPIIW